MTTPRTRTRGSARTSIGRLMTTTRRHAAAEPTRRSRLRSCARRATGLRLTRKRRHPVSEPFRGHRARRREVSAGLPADEPAPATVVQETFEPWPAGAARQSDDSFSAPTPIPAAEYAGVGDSPTLNVEAAEAAGVEFEGERGSIQSPAAHGKFEIARLEALIEGLTEKLEWRATGAIGNQQRLKH